MKDRVFIEGLRVSAIHGERSHERTRPQTFVVDVSVSVDLAKPGRSDDLHDALDYGRLRSIVAETFSAAPRHLLEKLASEVAERALEDERAIEVTVVVRKAEVYPDCVPGISITRSR